MSERATGPALDQTTSAESSFADLWDRTITVSPDRTFLIFEAEDGSQRAWSYRQFDAAVDAAAAVLSHHGLGPGRAVHVCLRNCPAFVAIWLACARLGGWMVPVDPSTGSAELQQQWDRTDPSVGVAARERRDAYVEPAHARGLVVIEFDETADDLDALIEHARSLPTRPATERATAAQRLSVMFTSGTTSQPKGVVLTQQNYCTVAREMACAAHLTETDRWLVTLPLFHANAQYYCFAPAIAVGASVALTSRFSASQWVAQARRLGATCASLFAAPIRMILARTPETQPPAALRLVWFAQNLGPSHHAAFGTLAGVAPRQLYGMTETVAVVTAESTPPFRPDWIGTALPGRTVRLIDPQSGTDAEPGEAGVLAVAGTPGVDVFLEYLDAPETTARTLRHEDGVTWLITGDLAVQGPDGAFQFRGRADDVIKVSGENVSLTELEAALAEAPGVLEAAVLPRADEIRDTVPVAYVVPTTGSEIDVAELDAWATQRLTRAARPVEWHVVADLPRTSVGKIRRFRLNIPTTNGAR